LCVVLFIGVKSFNNFENGQEFSSSTKNENSTLFIVLDENFDE
jgi:hypothetical protein